jgi:murein DD-endopeptidase MepM/ murein hydrolase activator NlpD
MMGGSYMQLRLVYGNCIVVDHGYGLQTIYWPP